MLSVFSKTFILDSTSVKTCYNIYIFISRHNNYLQECTGVRDPSHLYTVHDIKMLLMRFANEKSFSDESGGGGRQSNIYVLPYMIHMALYVINT